MAMHPEGMSRYSALARYILLPASAPIHKPTMRPAYLLSNAMFNIGKLNIGNYVSIRIGLEVLSGHILWPLRDASRIYRIREASSIVEAPIRRAIPASCTS